tara:strand:- start:129 stop:353 length:225 start_codon:yes stop_codon:yes gene_type:complete
MEEKDGVRSKINVGKERRRVTIVYRNILTPKFIMLFVLMTLAVLDFELSPFFDFLKAHCLLPCLLFKTISLHKH